jgi:hypothetical protein
MMPSLRYHIKMARDRVYVETTIPSFYHETRTDPDIVARREWTREWWSTAAELYELVTGPAVLDEWVAARQNTAANG